MRACLKLKRREFPYGKLVSPGYALFMVMDSLREKGSYDPSFYRNNYGECILRVSAWLMLLYVQFPHSLYQSGLFNVQIYPFWCIISIKMPIDGFVYLPLCPLRNVSNNCEYFFDRNHVNFRELWSLRQEIKFFFFDWFHFMI